MKKTGEWITKTLHIHTVELQSVTERNKTPTSEENWPGQEIIGKQKVQTERDKRTDVFSPMLCVYVSVSVCLCAHCTSVCVFVSLYLCVCFVSVSVFCLLCVCVCACVLCVCVYACMHAHGHVESGNEKRKPNNK